MFDSLFPKEWTTLQRLMWLKTNALARAVYEIVTGNPVSFTAKAAPLKQLKVAFSPVQTGTGDPSPDNVRPILGWDSLNVYDDPLYAGVIEWNQMVMNGNFADTSDWKEFGGTITASDNVCTFTITGTVTNLGIRIDTRAYMKRIAGHKYLTFMDVKTPRNTTGGRLYPVGNLYKQGISITANTWTTLSALVTEANDSQLGKTQFFLGYSADDGFVEGDTFEIRNVNTFDLTQMFGAGNEPATVEAFKALFPHDYYPYNAGTETLVGTVNGMDTRSISINLGQTVYSGTVDVVTGVVTVTMASVDLGTLTWAFNNPQYSIFMAKVNGMAINPDTASRNTGFALSAYKPSATISISGNMNDKAALRNDGYIFVRDTAYSDFATFASAMSGVQLVYELATPLPIQLTPQEVESLAGDNTMWSDANGDLTVEYRSN